MPEERAGRQGGPRGDRRHRGRGEALLGEEFEGCLLQPFASVGLPSCHPVIIPVMTSRVFEGTLMARRVINGMFAAPGRSCAMTDVWILGGTGRSARAITTELRHRGIRPV